MQFASKLLDIMQITGEESLLDLSFIHTVIDLPVEGAGGGVFSS